MQDYQGFWVSAAWTWKDILGFFWDLAKAAVPAGLAWVAYKVSDEAKQATQAQRDIAANQYKISLYDIRIKHLNSLNGWLNSHKITNISFSENIVDIVRNIGNTFNQRREVNEIIEILNLLRKYEEKSNQIFDDIFNGIKDSSETIEEQEKIGTQHKEKSEKLMHKLRHLKKVCQTELKVPQFPY